MGRPICFTKTLVAAVSNGIAHSQSPGTAALTLTANPVTVDTSTAGNTAIGRRVIVTSGGDDHLINWTVVGTNASGNTITDVFAGASGGDAQSNLDFVTVSSITPSGAVATTAIAGTNGVGSSQWITLNWDATSVMNVSFAVEVVSGSVNYTMQYTYDDPNNLLAGAAYPLPFSVSGVTAVTTTQDGLFALPIAAARVLINSGTGELRVRIMQSSIG